MAAKKKGEGATRLVTVQLFKGEGRHPWYLRLVADNGEVLAVSEGYFSRWNARRAARRNFADLRFVDLTKKEKR
jgi:hypothetical protein